MSGSPVSYVQTSTKGTGPAGTRQPGHTVQALYVLPHPTTHPSPGLGHSSRCCTRSGSGASSDDVLGRRAAHGTSCHPGALHPGHWLILLARGPHAAVKEAGGRGGSVEKIRELVASSTPPPLALCRRWLGSTVGCTVHQVCSSRAGSLPE